MGCGASAVVKITPLQLKKISPEVAEERLKKAQKQYENYKEISQFNGILENIPLQILFDLGFKIAFDEYYSQETSIGDLLILRCMARSNSLICIAGMNLEYSDEILQLACFDKVYDAIQISEDTHIASKTQSGNYIYCVEQHSFGFSPNENIQLENADQEDRECKNRLSWLLNGVGGGRLGNNWCAMTNTQCFRKIILIKQ